MTTDTPETKDKKQFPLGKFTKWIALGTGVSLLFILLIVWFGIPYVTKNMVESGKITPHTTNQNTTKTGVSESKSAQDNTSQNTTTNTTSITDTTPTGNAWLLPNLRKMALNIKSKLAKQGYRVDYEVHDVSRDTIDLFPTITLKKLHIHDPKSGITKRAETATIVPVLSLDTIQLNVTLDTITLTKTVMGQSAIITMDKATAQFKTPWQAWLKNKKMSPIATIEKQFFNAELTAGNTKEKLLETAQANVTLHAQNLKSIGEHLWQGKMAPAYSLWVEQNGFMAIETLDLTIADTGFIYTGKVGLQKLGTASGHITLKNFDSFVNFVASKRLVTLDMKASLRMGALLLGGEPKENHVIFPIHSDGETLKFGTLKIDLKHMYTKINNRIARPIKVTDKKK